VAADAAVDGDLEDLLLRVQVDRVARPLEAGELDVTLERREVLRRPRERRVALVRDRRRIVHGRVERRRVVEVDPPVLFEVRVEGDRLQPLLVVLVHVELGGERLQARLLVVEPHLAGALRVEHAAVRQHGEVDGLARRLVDHDLLELRVGRRRLGRRRRRDGAYRKGPCQGCERSCSAHVCPPWHLQDQ
jgi:hypothetical protein